MRYVAVATVLVLFGWLVCGAGSALAIHSLVGFGGVGTAWRTTPGHWLLGIGVFGGLAQLLLGLRARRRTPSPWLGAPPLAAALYAGWQALTSWYAVLLPPKLSALSALAILDPPALPQIITTALIEAFDLATLGASVASGLCAQAALAALAALVSQRLAEPREQRLALARTRSTVAAGVLGALALALAAFWCRAQATVYFALEFVGAPRTPAFAELPVVLERQSVAGLLQLLLVPALLGAWWLLRGRKRVDDSEPPLRIPLPRPRARLDLLKPQLLIGLLAAVPLTFWLGAVGGRLRAAAAFKALDDQIAPPELVPALVPEAMQGTHGGNRPLFVSAQGIYTRKKTHIVRLEDARRLDGADCLQVLTGLDLNPDASAGTRREYFPSSVLLDRGADAHTLACSLLYVSLSPQQGDNYATKVGYGIAAAQFIDPMWQRFLVRNVVPNLPEEYAVFRHSWYEVGLVPTFLGTERYSNRRPPHVHLAKSGWRFRVDSDRDHPAREGTLVGTTDERLARLKEKLDVIYALHVSADTSVPAADVLRIAAAFRSVALYVGADVAAQLEPEREVREPYAGPRPEP